MAIRLEDPDSGASIRLWQAQQTDDNIETGLTATSIFSFGTGDTILINFEGEEELTLVGRATGNRLSNQSGYSSDPLTALAQYGSRLESFVSGEQGSGYELVDSTRDISFTGMLSEAGWTRNRGEAHDLYWEVTFLRADGFGAPGSPSPESVSPSNSATVSTSSWAHDLGDIEINRTVREQDLSLYRLASFAGFTPGDNLAFSMSGAIRKVTLQGRKVGSESELNQFDSDLRSLTDAGFLTYTSAFPGREMEAGIRYFDSIRDADEGQRISEYRLELVEGVDVIGFSDLVERFSAPEDDDSGESNTSSGTGGVQSAGAGWSSYTMNDGTSEETEVWTHG